MKLPEQFTIVMQLALSLDVALAAPLLAEVEAKLAGFVPQNVSNAVWAAATLELRPDAQLLAALVARFRNQLMQANSQARHRSCRELRRRPTRSTGQDVLRPVDVVAKRFHSGSVDSPSVTSGSCSPASCRGNCRLQVAQQLQIAETMSKHCNDTASPGMNAGAVQCAVGPCDAGAQSRR